MKEINHLTVLRCDLILPVNESMYIEEFNVNDVCLAGEYHISHKCFCLLIFVTKCLSVSFCVFDFFLFLLNYFDIVL